MAIIQVRVDEELKKTAEYFFNEIGLDLSTAIRMFLKKSCMVRGLPFDANIDEDSFNWVLSMRLYTMTNEEKKKIKDVSLDTINEEIDKARQERKKNNK